MKAQDFLTKYGKDGRITRSEIKDYFTGNLANLEQKAKNFGVMIGEKGLQYIKQELGSQQAPIPFAPGLSVADVKNIDPIFPVESYVGPFVGPIQEGPEGFYEVYGADGKITKEELKNHFTGKLENVERKAANKGIKLGDKAIAYIRNQLGTDNPSKEEMVTVNYGSGTITVPASQAGNLTVNGTNLVELAAANTPQAPGSSPVVENQPETQTQGVDIGGIINQITSGSGGINPTEDNPFGVETETASPYVSAPGQPTDSVEDQGVEAGGVGDTTPATSYVPTDEDRAYSESQSRTQYGFNPTAYLAAYTDVANLAKEFAGEDTSDQERAYLGGLNDARGTNFSDFSQMNTNDAFESIAYRHNELVGFDEGRTNKEEYQEKAQEFEEGKLDDFIKGLKDAVVSSSASGAQAGGVGGV